MPSRLDLARRATLAAWIALLAALGGWHATTHARPVAAVLLAATVAPLLFALPGLWRGRRYTYRWAPLTLAPGLAWALTEIVANPGQRAIAALCGALACLALATVVATLRAMPAGR